MNDGRDVAERFRDAWATHDPATATPELLPMRLARACVATLPITAAGISVFDHGFRVPLGASDDTAVAAERMQFTHGEGPCLDAAAHHAATHLTLEQMAQRWPAFTDDLAAHTPYRAIVSVPLPVRPGVTGALDLYFHDPAEVATMALTDVMTVIT